ncbi:MULTISPECIES: sodium-dependent transporter [unclassified Thioalkalivibrio]|uniref:sodium-dependent transporter n=1 Tax=unclassified Thioalkalivibrio TaxID=2621013 RepID=UPI00037DA689|nr:MULTISPECIES: sodium-dependent transporter [unclassified Thioalkalivibrio]
MDITATAQRWSHGYAFFLAATASAVGLGNVWKFPYILGQNGGGAFLLVYLGCIILIGIPIMMAEVMIGRRGRRSPGYAAREVARESGAHDIWQLVGWLGLLAAFMIMSFYVVITGWAFSYVHKAATGAFAGADGGQVAGVFAAMTASPAEMLAWSTLAVTLAFAIVALGLRQGLERGLHVLMPVLLGLLLTVLASAWWIGEPRQALDFLLRPDFSALTAHGMLIAVGHAFFTMTLAAGVLMMFGAYLPRETSIARTAIGVALADTAVALIAGMAIFPIVFGFGLDPAEGPGLMFQTVPLALAAVPAGVVLTTLFFATLSLAAFSTMITNARAFVHLFHERLHASRIRAALACGGAVWLLSLASVFSFSGAAWARLDITVLGRDLPTLYHAIEHIAINLLLPVGGLLIAVFAGWVVKDRVSREEIGLPPVAFAIWRFVLRYVAPIGLGLLLLNLAGVL